MQSQPVQAENPVRCSSRQKEVPQRLLKRDLREMAEQAVSATFSTQQLTAEQELVLQQLVTHHPGMVKAALMAAEESPKQVTTSAKGQLEKEMPSPHPSLPEKEVSSTGEPTTKIPTQEVPLWRYASRFYVDSQEERRRVEVAASRYMDGFDTGADWVMRDRRKGTVKQWDEARGFGFIEEDYTEQEIFVNRRAVKHQAEPKWRHNLVVGERVTYVKLGSKRGLWAVAVLRASEAPLEDESPPSPRGRPETPVRAESPTSGHVIGGSVHAEGHATIHLESHQYSPPIPAPKKVSYVVTREAVPDSSSEELQLKETLHTTELRQSPPRLPVTVSTAEFGYPQGFTGWGSMGVNPYLHRGPDYSSVRGPAIRRGPPMTRSVQGEWVFRHAI